MRAWKCHHLVFDYQNSGWTSTLSDPDFLIVSFLGFLSFVIPVRDTKNIKATCLNLTKGPGATMEWWNFDISNLDYRFFFNTGRFSLFTLSSMEELITWTTSMNSVLMFLPVHCHQRWKGKAQTCQDLKHTHNLKRHQHLNQLSRMKIIGLHQLTELTPDIHRATAFVREI